MVRRPPRSTLFPDPTLFRFVGLLVRTVGEDEAVGMARFNFGNDALLSGFDFIAVLIGLFAFSQLLNDVRDPKDARRALTERGSVEVRIEHGRAIGVLIKHWVVVIRSSLIGVFTGILPGAGGSIANILAYDQAKKASKHPRSEERCVGEECRSRWAP